jgi:predicted small metal-binding protein
MDDTIRSVRCACGWEARGTLDELVQATMEHGREVHNMTPTRDEVMAMVVPLEAAGPEPAAGSRG